jgi:hypothetical protein
MDNINIQYMCKSTVSASVNQLNMWTDRWLVSSGSPKHPEWFQALRHQAASPCAPGAEASVPPEWVRRLWQLGRPKRCYSWMAFGSDPYNGDTLGSMDNMVICIICMDIPILSIVFSTLNMDIHSINVNIMGIWFSSWTFILITNAFLKYSPKIP